MGGVWLVAVLFGGHGDELLGGFGNVVGALDDLLRDQLDVGGGGWARPAALAVQPAGAGGEQRQGAANRLRGRPLPGKDNEMRERFGMYCQRAIQ